MPRTRGLVQKDATSNGLLRTAHERNALLSVARHYTKIFRREKRYKPNLWSLDRKLDLMLEALRDVLIGRNFVGLCRSLVQSQKDTPAKHQAIRLCALRLT